MNKNYYAPIRKRADGSIYLDKSNYFTKFLAGAAAILVLPLLFTAILMFALIDPFDVEAQRYENTQKPEGIGGPENAASETDVNIVKSNIAAENMPSIYPVEGRLTSNFGYRTNPFGGVSSEFHPGQDIAAPNGTPVIAPADGEVVFSGWQRGYGNIVIIEHGGGLSTRYAHLSESDVLVKQLVKRGEKIGKVGSTGRSTGAHLHYEVRVDNKSVNPMEYLPQE
jgi:murein DD-endopeptidase MepM/ murein hydrolase activator NlpD